MSKWFLPYQIGPRRPHWWSVLCVATGTSSCSSSSSLPAVWLCGVMIDLSFSFTLPPPQHPPNSPPLYTKMPSLPREWVRSLLDWFFFNFWLFADATEIVPGFVYKVDGTAYLVRAWVAFKGVSVLFTTWLLSGTLLAIRTLIGTP